MPAFADIAEGRQYISGNANHARHTHAVAYAAIVLRGSYEEAGGRGRYRVSEGDVLLHDAFDAHCDRFERQPCEILNLRLPDGYVPPAAFGRLAGMECVVTAAARDRKEAAAMVMAALRPAAQSARDWPDRLAADLWADPNLCLGDWAARHGLARETVSRGFSRIWCVTPARFRSEVRARKAWTMIASGAAPLAAVAARCGFADQAHMTRAVVAVTGRTPGEWRRSNRFKTNRYALS